MGHNRHKERRQQELAAAALAAGQYVVVDNTNPTIEERAQLIALGHAYGTTVVGYYFESRVGVSLERNKGREGTARVPDVAIFVTVKRLQWPSYAEGFNRLYDVRIVGDGAFEVLDRPDESDSKRMGDG